MAKGVPRLGEPQQQSPHSREGAQAVVSVNMGPGTEGIAHLPRGLIFDEVLVFFTCSPRCELG